jgi:hypothetical protein
MKGEEWCLFLSFSFKSDKFSDFFDIAGWTQYTYIVVKYKIHLYSLRNRPEKLAKGSLYCLFLKLVQINFIFTDNIRILYMYRVHLAMNGFELTTLMVIGTDCTCSCKSNYMYHTIMPMTIIEYFLSNTINKTGIVWKYYKDWTVVKLFMNNIL